MNETTLRTFKDNLPATEKHSKRNLFCKALVYVFIWLIFIITLVPLLTLFLASFKGQMEQILYGSLALPHEWRWVNYSEAWTVGHFQTYFLNTIFVGIVVTIASIFMSLLGTYGLVTLKLPFGDFWLALFLLGLIIPEEGVIIPLFYNLHAMKLTNTYWALILPQIAMSVSFGAFFLRPSFAAIPGDLLDSARIDGCNNYKVLMNVVLPIVKPALNALAVFFFLATWNEYLIPLVLTIKEELLTLPLGLSLFSGRFTTNVSLMAAGTVIVAFPIIIFYSIFQRQFVEGVASGAVKG